VRQLEKAVKLTFTW